MDLTISSKTCSSRQRSSNWNQRKNNPMNYNDPYTNPPDTPDGKGFIVAVAVVLIVLLLLIAL